MTPGIDKVKKARLAYQLHQYSHDASSDSYGREAAEILAVPEERVFKTLVVRLESNELAVGVAPVNAMLNMKLMAKALGAKKASMAQAADVDRSTGYVLGGVSPLGQKKELRTVIHSSAASYPTIFVSAGRRGLEIELDPRDLAKLTRGKFAEICL